MPVFDSFRILIRDFFFPRFAFEEYETNPVNIKGIYLPLSSRKNNVCIVLILKISLFYISKSYFLGLKPSNLDRGRYRMHIAPYTRPK